MANVLLKKINQNINYIFHIIKNIYKQKDDKPCFKKKTLKE